MRIAAIASPPLQIGQVLIRPTDYATAIIDDVELRGSWYYLVSFNSERIWLSASTVRNQGFVPIEQAF